MRHLGYTKEDHRVQIDDGGNFVIFNPSLDQNMAKLPKDEIEGKDLDDISVVRELVKKASGGRYKLYE